MKLNLGCGFDKRNDYINLDCFSKCEPDVIHDIEKAPLPFPDNTFDEILIKHVLEHLGETFDKFRTVMQEIYRISKPNAKIDIQVPNYKHVSFWADPTHVRAFDEFTFKMMSRKQNDKWIAQKTNYTMLSYILDVDFELENMSYAPDHRAIEIAKNNSSKPIGDVISDMNFREWNAIREFRFELRVIKN